MYRKTITRSVPALMFAGVLSSGSTTAEEQSAAVDQPALETVTVTATRIDQSVAEVARSIAVVDRQVIESIQPQSVAGALAYLPNISIAGGPRANNQSVNIRGLGGNKVLQTIDRARQNFESGHRPSYFLDPALLQSVEALRGPASSLWGSGALGGVVAQNTIDADSFLVDGQELGGFLRTGYNSNNQQSTSTVAALGRVAQADWLLSGYYRDSDNLEMGNGEELQGSASEDRGVLAKVNWTLAEGHSLHLSFRAADAEGTVPANGAAEPDDSSNFLIERDQETTNASIRYDFAPDSDWITGQALAYWNQVDVDETRIEDARPDQTELDMYGLSISNLSRLDQVTLLYGVDAYREDFSADRGGDNRPSPPQAQTDVWSLYAQANLPLASGWRVELGARYDDFSTEADNLDDQRSDNDTSLSAALVWEPRDWLLLALRYDEAFRAPSAEELYSSGTHFCIFPGFCNSFVPNPELDPEQAANTEVLAQLKFSEVAGADTLSLELSVFHNEVDDFIEQVVQGPFFFPLQDPGNTSWHNVDEATIEGFEAQASYLRDSMSLHMSYGVTRGEDDENDADLTNIPADTFIADLGYRLWRKQVIAGVRYTHADEQNRTEHSGNNTETSYDSYELVDLYASWQPGSVPGLKLDLNVNNLTDEFYRRAWGELPEAGREIIVSARYSF